MKFITLAKLSQNIIGVARLSAAMVLALYVR